MSAAFRAIVRESVFFTRGNRPALAPFGEYDIARDSDDQITFKSRASKSAFTLSLDALVQHLSEGRISLVGGRSLPPIPVRKAG